MYNNEVAEKLIFVHFFVRFTWMLTGQNAYFDKSYSEFIDLLNISHYFDTLTYRLTLVIYEFEYLFVIF